MRYKSIVKKMMFYSIIAVLALAACQPMAAPTPTVETGQIPVTGVITPSVQVNDQAVEYGSVTVELVVSDGPGWIVIHADQNGSPGSVIGHAAVSNGENQDVTVEIDTESATGVLYAMLHVDNGEVGRYDFPGDDAPVVVEGSPISPAFNVTGGLSEMDTMDPAETKAAMDSMMTPSVSVSDQSLKNGSVVIDKVVSDGQGWIVIHADQDGSPGPVIGHAAVNDGKNMDVMVAVDESQITDTLYAMLHIDAGTVGEYEFPGDDGPARVNGKVVTPAFEVKSDSMDDGMDYGSDDMMEPDVKVSSTPELGEFLVDAEGMTLYLFTNDTENVSNCSGGCLEAWPPLLVDGEPVAGEGVDESKLGVITRDDGSMQVTYDGWPLYYYVADTQPGDVTGEGVNDVWFVLEP